MGLTNAVALVTGGSGGLGACICAHLAQAGVDVAVGFKSGPDRAEGTAATHRAGGRRAITVSLDQASPASIEDAIAAVIAEFGRLDILINNAAITTGGHDIAPGDLAALTPEIWDEIMSINLRGPYLVTRAAAPHLRASDWGRVVNIGSTVGKGEWYADRAFAPSKAAVVPLTRFLAASLAPDVTVNCVCPGIMPETTLATGGPPELYQRWRDRAALGTTTALDDVARQVVAACASPTMTGQSIVVDGGIHFD
ncbi:MAG: SDR family NAD(P)-dependent oxidoreductase [Pseudomonadota bacterium]